MNAEALLILIGTLYGKNLELQEENGGLKERNERLEGRLADAEAREAAWAKKARGGP